MVVSLLKIPVMGVYLDKVKTSCSNSLVRNKNLFIGGTADAYVTFK
jgi:hypothetical protein